MESKIGLDLNSTRLNNYNGEVIDKLVFAADNWLEIHFKSGKRLEIESVNGYFACPCLNVTEVKEQEIQDQMFLFSKQDLLSSL